MNMKKILAMMLAVLLIVTATVAGTVAWLMDSTDPVANTFTVGKVDINLEEHSYDTTNNNKVTTTVENDNFEKETRHWRQSRCHFLRKFR